MSKVEAEAEAVIFDLRKKADLCLQVGDAEGFARIQNTITNLQKTTGAVKGAERKDHARGNDSGSQRG
jgi:hypothetical protein